MARIISFINHKGGVGKTTSTQSIGYGLHRFAKQKVLLVDLDSQANLTRCCGFLPQDQPRDIFAALSDDGPLPILDVEPGLWLVPSSLSLSVAELKLGSRIGREFLLLNLLEPIADQYDFILIDCPPSLALLTINAMMASTDVFIPLEPEFLSLYGLDNINLTLQEIRRQLRRQIDITGVFLTKFDSRLVLHRSAMQTARVYFPKTLFQTRVRRNVSLSEAQASGACVYDYAPGSNGADDYKTLTLEIIKYFQKQASKS